MSSRGVWKTTGGDFASEERVSDRGGRKSQEERRTPRGQKELGIRRAGGEGEEPTEEM